MDVSFETSAQQVVRFVVVEELGMMMNLIC
jgi:hypothetical protein